MQNLTKWVNLSFLVCGVLGWALLREIFLIAFDPLGWNRMNWLIAPSDLAGILGGAVLFIGLWKSQKANVFLTEVITELSQVTWPKRKETALSTGVVSILLTIATLAILLFDSIWAWLAEQFLYG